MPARRRRASSERPDLVLVTYNSEPDLARQAPATLREAFHEVISVDNGSADRSVGLARDQGFATLCLEGNRGYAAAVNAGIRRSSAPYVAIMNPDVVVDSPAAVARLLAHLDDPAVGLVAPALVLPDGARQDSARRVPAPLELVARRVSGAQHGRIDARLARPVDWVVGAFMCMRREAFDAVGGFDDRYRFYFEDVDFCVRLWSAGYKVVYDPTVVLRHEHGAGSRKTFFGWAMRQHMRSAARFYRKHPALATQAGRRAASRRWVRDTSELRVEVG